jgi:hypothetical protein
MSTPDVDVDQDTRDRVRARVLKTEDEQLHYDRPPQIIKDLKSVIEEEVTEVEISDDA